MTGFMTLWHGFSTTGSACWFPWLLVAINGAVHNPRGSGSVGVAVFATLVLLAGHIGMAGLVLLTAGLYAVWLLVELGLRNKWRSAISSASAIGMGWLLGFAISTPAILPLLQYSREGVRMDCCTRKGSKNALPRASWLSHPS